MPLQNIDPLHYQREAADKALAALTDPPHKGVRGFFVGDKMGLGKTVEALMIADELPKTENLIAVVCPAFWCLSGGAKLRKNARRTVNIDSSSNRFRA